MARSLDQVVRDDDGFVRVGDDRGTVLFRVIGTASGPMVHIRLPLNCRQVRRRGDPDYYIPWDEFKLAIEDAER